MSKKRGGTKIGGFFRRRQQNFKFPDEFIWNRTKFSESVNRANAIITAYQELVEQFNEFHTHEISFGVDVIKSLSEEYKISEEEEENSEVKPKSKMSEEEIKTQVDLEEFYKELGQTLSDTTTKRKLAMQKIGGLFRNAVEVLNKDKQVTDGTRDDYETSMKQFNSTNQKLAKMESELSELEEKRKSVKEMVKKEALKEKEKKILGDLQESGKAFGELQKLSMFVEQQTCDELEFQVKRLDVDFTVVMCQYIEEMKNYYETAFDNWSKLSKQVAAQQRIKKFTKKPTRRKATRIKNVRPIYLPQEYKLMIGVDLEQVMVREHERGAIPKYAKQMLEYIYKILQSTGIFRLAGKKEMVEIFKRNMDSGKELDFSKVTNPNSVCELLKNYTRGLPESFCPMSFFDDWSKNKTVENMKTALKQMSPANYIYFYKMMKLGKDTEAHEAKNKMNSKNLAVVWAPNLFKTPEAWLKDPGMLKTLALKNSEMMEVYQFILKHFSEIWPSPPPKPKYEKVRIEVTREGAYGTFETTFGRPASWASGQPETLNITNLDVDLSVQEEVEGESDDEEEEEEEEESVNLNDLEMTKEISVSSLMKNEIKNASPFTAIETNDHWIIAGDHTGGIQIFELSDTGIKPLPTFELRKEHNGPVTRIMMLKPGEGIFMTASEDKTVKIWRIGVKKSIGTIESPNEEPCSNSFKPPSQNMYIVSFGNDMYAYRMGDWTKLIHQYESVPQSKVTQIFESYGKLYSVTENDGVMYVWDYNKPKLSTKMTRRREKVCYACPSTSKKCKVVTYFTNGKYANWESEKKNSVMDTFKKKRIKGAFELNAKKDYFVILFDMGARKDFAALAISNCGIIVSFNQTKKVVGIRKYGKKFDNRFYLWDEGSTIKCYNQKRVEKKFESPSRMSHVVPFYREQFLLSVGEDNSIRIYDVRV